MFLSYITFVKLFCISSGNILFSYIKAMLCTYLKYLERFFIKAIIDIITTKNIIIGDSIPIISVMFNDFSSLGILIDFVIIITIIGNNIKIIKLIIAFFRYTFFLSSYCSNPVNMLF